MQDIKPIAVTGATGFVGRSVVRELRRRGWPVRALVRDADKAQRVLGDGGAELVVGDVLDRRTPGRLLAGAGAVVHLIGIIREAPGGQTFRRMHVHATEAITEAARATGVTRIVHMSALGADLDARTEYWRTKAAAERIVQRSGLRWTILRPSLIHGPGGEFMQQVKGWVTGRSAPFVFLPYFSRLSSLGPPPKFEAPSAEPVYVEDVAAVVAETLAARNSDAIGEIYPLAGSERLTWPELLIWARDHIPNAKRALKPMGIPGEVAALKARGCAMLGLKHAMPFDEGMAVMGQADSVAKTSKAAEQLGVRFRPFRRTMAEYAVAM